MIITDESKLRLNCVDVLPEEIGSLIDQLEIELKRSEELGRPGIGLAAPQIGLPKNIAIIREGKHNINLINAKIDEGYDKYIFNGEGCLSFPNKYVSTMRYQQIYINNSVEPYKFLAKGLLAVVIQHELDHLRGVLLPDLEIKKSLLSNKKIRPNDPCPCGALNINTGAIIKYKKCHGK